MGALFCKKVRKNLIESKLKNEEFKSMLLKQNKNKDVEYIKLFNNKISLKSCFVLSSLIKNNRNLRGINLKKK